MIVRATGRMQDLQSDHELEARLQQQAHIAMQTITGDLKRSSYGVVGGAPLPYVFDYVELHETRTLQAISGGSVEVRDLRAAQRSLAAIEESLDGTGLLIEDVRDIRDSYALTLKTWRETFFAKIDEVKAMGFDDRFIRMWDYYLSISEAGFRTGMTQDLQIAFEKSRARVAS